MISAIQSVSIQFTKLSKQRLLNPMTGKIPRYVQARGFFSTRTAKEEAKQPNYINTQTKHEFSPVVKENMNGIAQYRKHQSSIKTFWDRLKGSLKGCDVKKTLNEIIEALQDLEL